MNRRCSLFVCLCLFLPADPKSLRWHCLCHDNIFVLRKTQTPRNGRLDGDETGLITWKPISIRSEEITCLVDVRSQLVFVRPWKEIVLSVKSAPNDNQEAQVCTCAWENDKFQNNLQCWLCSQQVILFTHHQMLWTFWARSSWFLCPYPWQKEKKQWDRKNEAMGRLNWMKQIPSVERWILSR